MEITINKTKIILLEGDITTREVDCIVNAANSSLLGGGGVDGAIHWAGGKEILEACIKIREKQGGCAEGDAVITTAGKLKAKHVIHTVGPVWNGGKNGEDEKLKSCYRRSLELAQENNARSIAFPNISTGVYCFPKERAAGIAINAVLEFVRYHDSISTVEFVCFDEENYRIYEERMVLL